MNNQLKVYINKLFSYVPVAVSVFTLVFFISISSSLQDIKAELGAESLDFVMEYYRFYFFRTILFALFIPMFDFVLDSKKYSRLTTRIIHCLLINLTVGIMFFRIGDKLVSILITLLMCTVIYMGISLIIVFREKQFINQANKFFEENRVE